MAPLLKDLREQSGARGVGHVEIDFEMCSAAMAARLLRCLEEQIAQYALADEACLGTLNEANQRNEACNKISRTGANERNIERFRPASGSLSWAAHDAGLTCIVRLVEVGSVLEQNSTELIGERSHAIVGRCPLVELRLLRMHPATSISLTMLDRVRGRGADGVQQRLAGVIARRCVEGAMLLDEAQQTSAMLSEARCVHRTVDTVEALQEG